MTPSPIQQQGIAAIKQAAASNGVAWQPLVAIAHHESNLDPNAVGDNGTSFGLFQTHVGGVLPAGTSPQVAKGALWNANLAARAVKALGIQNLPFAQQTYQISKRFERPTNVAGETQDANNYLRALGSAAPAAPGTAPANASTLALSPPNTSIPAQTMNLAPLQASLALGQAQNQKALDALGKISGHQVQAASAPDIASLISQVQAAAPNPQASHVTVPLKGPTPKGVSPQAEKAIELARTYLGDPYQFGGSTHKGIDCSALIQNIWKANGVNLPRTAAEQYKVGKPVEANALKPGDALYFQTEGAKAGVTHTALYIGNGQLLEAPHTGDVVKIAPLAGYYQQHLVGARRFA